MGAITGSLPSSSADCLHDSSATTMEVSLGLFRRHEAALSNLRQGAVHRLRCSVHPAGEVVSGLLHRFLVFEGRLQGLEAKRMAPASAGSDSGASFPIHPAPN